MTRIIHINTSTHQHITTSSHHHITTSSHQHINTSTHQHINTSSHQHINTSTHQHIMLRWLLPTTQCDSQKPLFNIPTTATLSPPETPSPIAPDRSKVLWAIGVGVGVVVVGLHLVVGPFLLPALRSKSAPYVYANTHTHME
jgi:hypothetical protein